MANTAAYGKYLKNNNRWTSNLSVPAKTAVVPRGTGFFSLFISFSFLLSLFLLRAPQPVIICMPVLIQTPLHTSVCVCACVRVCSLSYPPFKAHAPYYTAVSYLAIPYFFRLSHKQHEFREKSY